MPLSNDHAFVGMQSNFEHLSGCRLCSRSGSAVPAKTTCHAQEWHPIISWTPTIQNVRSQAPPTCSGACLAEHSRWRLGAIPCGLSMAHQLIKCTRFAVGFVSRARVCWLVAWQRVTFTENKFRFQRDNRIKVVTKMNVKRWNNFRQLHPIANIRAVRCIQLIYAFYSTRYWTIICSSAVRRSYASRRSPSYAWSRRVRRSIGVTRCGCVVYPTTLNNQTATVGPETMRCSNRTQTRSCGRIYIRTAVYWK